jgi:Uma2 family endonuclease
VSSPADELSWATFEEYLLREQASERRQELVGGRVYVMAGGSERHDLVAGLVYEALAAGARRQGCRPFIANRLLRAGEAGCYPDVMVVCEPAADRLYESDAGLLVEVSSPSTVDVDRREKAAAYANLASLRLYILLDPEHRRLEVAQARPGGGLEWQAFGPGTVVPTRYGDLVVDELYDALDASATT